MIRLSVLALVAALAAPAAWADDIAISDAWSRATPSADGAGVVYLTAQDNGEPDMLTGAETPVAAHADLHQTSMSDGVMHMDAVPSLPIGADSPVVLAPGGYHLMLTGLTRKLDQGETFPLTLIFAKAGRVETTVHVLEAGARGFHSP